MMLLFAALIIASLLNIVISECPNACSSHGRCGAYDMCQCYRNWMANDCSERICQFGLAHVDSPKGDLDASGKIEAPGNIDGGTNIISVEKSFMYPYGTTEKYPDTRNARSIGDKKKEKEYYILETAHFPMECSNKGLCDRSTGTCVCYPGYSGSSCQYASCPSTSLGLCSGHGVCMDAKAWSLADNGIPYRLWDQHKTLGCKCDSGYSGPDCANRECKYGPDPLYYDDTRNIRHPTFTYQFSTAGTGGGVDAIGNYSIIFYDRLGEDWQTVPIDIGASCSSIIKALEGLPNNVIPIGSVLCFKHLNNALVANDVPIPSGITYQSVFYPYIAATSTQTLKYTKYTISFTGNPGKIKQPTINMYLDGLRPTLTTTESKSTLGYDMYINGFGPEDADFVPDLCEGVQLSLNADGTLNILTESAKMFLKRCLGDSNGYFEDNRDVFNWDYGALSDAVSGKVGSSPHLIKLIDSTQDSSATIFTTTNSNLYDMSLAKYSQTILCPKDTTTTTCNSPNPPGFYVVIFWDKTAAAFKTVTQPNTRFATSVNFNVYTTQSYVTLMQKSIGSDANAYTYGGVTAATSKLENASPSPSPAATSVDISAAARSDSFSNVIYTKKDLSCEGIGGSTCIEKGDYIMVLDIEDRTKNPAFPNIYQVLKIEISPPRVNEGRRFKITLDYGVNTNYFIDDDAYIFKLKTVNTYKYVTQCSGRGICDAEDGLCQCFKGYTGDDCGIQNSLVQ